MRAEHVVSWDSWAPPCMAGAAGRGAWFCAILTRNSSFHSLHAYTATTV